MTEYTINAFDEQDHCTDTRIFTVPVTMTYLKPKLKRSDTRKR